MHQARQRRLGAPWQRNAAFLYALERLVYSHATLQTHGPLGRPLGRPHGGAGGAAAAAAAAAAKALAAMLPAKAGRLALLTVQHAEMAASPAGDTVAHVAGGGGGASSAKVVPFTS